MAGIPKKLSQALDALLKEVNEAESEDNDIIVAAMHVLLASGRTPGHLETRAARHDPVRTPTGLRPGFQPPPAAHRAGP